MPSLHFATSLMAALLLTEAGPAEGAAGWAYAGTLGFALVYLGEHYVIDLLAGAALVVAVRRGERYAEPVAQAVSRGLQRLERIANRGVTQAGSGSAFANIPGVREERPQSASEPRGRPHREMVAEAEPSFFADPKRLIQTGDRRRPAAGRDLRPRPEARRPRGRARQDRGRRPGLDRARDRLQRRLFAAYVALFRGVVGEKVIHLEWSESYQITMAGLAATRLFSAGGAGGIVLTYWALRKAGMERRQSVCRMVAFLVLLYSVYLAALVIFGILLRTDVLSGEAPLSGTIIPAALAGVAIVIGLLIALLPDDFERRIERQTSGRFGASPSASRPSPRPSRRAPAPRSPSSATRGAPRWRRRRDRLLGAPTSRSSGRASTPSTSRSRSASWSRASSSA